MERGPGEALRPAVISPPLRTTRPWTRAIALAVYGVALLLWVSTFGVPSDAVQIFGWLWFATIAWNVEAPRRQHLGFLRDWWLPMAALVVYFYSRGLADEVFKMPVHLQMPISVDSWLFAGDLPTYWLQERLCGSPCDPASEPRWYDLSFAVVYTTHFVVGLTLAMVLWLWNRGEWKKWMRRYVGANLAALVIYVVYPMAPPWMASDEGYLAHEVFRITHRGWEEVGLGRFHLVLTGVGNPVAAMPSLHAGIAFLIALYGIQRLRTPLRWLLLAYPLAMSVGLVYFGEHYVIDIVAGALLAAAVLWACSWWERIRGD
jgi:membrane-associated phospholipid phosphatase